MGRDRKRQAEKLHPAAVALLKRMQASEDRAREILANTASSDIEKAVTSKLASADLPPEIVQRFTAALENEGPHYKRRERAEQNLREITRLNADGKTDGIIAKTLGLSRPHVCNVRRANGIPAVRR